MKEEKIAPYKKIHFVKKKSMAVVFRPVASKSEFLQVLLAPITKPVFYLILILRLALKAIIATNQAIVGLVKLKPIEAYDHFIMSMICLCGSVALLLITVLSPLWITLIAVGCFANTLLLRASAKR